MNMTPIDKALENAQKDKVNQMDFYNLFLRSDFFIPTHDAPEKHQEKRSEKGESISPILIESEGRNYLMLFDSLERLSSWATREIGYIRLPGHTIAKMMDTETYWTLNVESKYYKEFVPDEIKWLKVYLSKSGKEEILLEKDTKFIVREPAQIPDGLIDVLSETMKRNSEISEAYLGQVYYLCEGERPHLALVLRTETINETIADSIKNDLWIASRGDINEEDFIDIHIEYEQGVPYAITKAVSPFYIRKEEYFL